MGRYSRKDMIEFAKFAKSYQSPKNVKKAYDEYLKGVRMITMEKRTDIQMYVMKSNVCYINGQSFRDRYKVPDIIIDNSRDFTSETVRIKSWNPRTKVLHLETKRDSRLVLPKVDESKVKKCNEGI